MRLARPVASVSAISRSTELSIFGNHFSFQRVLPGRDKKNGKRQAGPMSARRFPRCSAKLGVRTYRRPLSGSPKRTVRTHGEKTNRVHRKYGYEVTNDKTLPVESRAGQRGGVDAMDLTASILSRRSSWSSSDTGLGATMEKGRGPRPVDGTENAQRRARYNRPMEDGTKRDRAAVPSTSGGGGDGGEGGGSAREI